jgi:uncharacterized membrane protein
MELVFKTLAGDVALACEALAALLLAVGVIEVVIGLVLGIPRWSDLRLKKMVWVRFASWLLLALELTLAADIVRTAIAPTWNDIGQLAAIAAIRTVLNLFLERDLESSSRDLNLAAFANPPPARTPQDS